MLNAHRELNCLGEDWGGHPSSAQHLVGHLLGRFRVIWINSLGCRTPRLSHHDFAWALSKLRAAARGIERPHPDLFFYTLQVVPWYRDAAVRRLNVRLLYSAMHHLAERENHEHELWMLLMLEVWSRMHARTCVAA